MNLDKINNFSLEPDWQILKWFNSEFFNDHVLETTVLPDVCPAGIVPNGTVTYVKKNWLDYFSFRDAIGDIGCAMSFAYFPNFDDDQLQIAWNELYQSLIDLNKTILGSGNHFIDACKNRNGDLVILVHVGSRMTTEEKKNFNFKRDYKKFAERALANHQEIWECVKKIFGNFEGFVLLDHDSVVAEADYMILRKGVTDSASGAPILIASSFEDIITVGVARSNIGELRNSMSHGTGRQNSRSQAKNVLVDQRSIRQRIIIPDDLSDESWRLESPVHYRDSALVLGLMSPYIDIVDEFLPVAFMGGF